MVNSDGGWKSYDVLNILAQMLSSFLWNSLDASGLDRGSSWPGGSWVGGGGCKGKRFFLTRLYSMYLGEEVVGFLGLVTEVWYWADSAPFGVLAEAAEVALVGAGEDVEDGGATEEVALVWSWLKGRILPLKGRKISADSADFLDLMSAWCFSALTRSFSRLAGPLWRRWGRGGCCSWWRSW